MGELIAPSVPAYMCSVLISAIPKIFLILAACAVTAYRTEMYFSYELERDTQNTAHAINTDVPIEICWHVEDEEQYRGDRICNNAVGAAVCTVIISVMLMMIDMLIPCLSAGFARLATMFTILWSVLMAAYWLVTGALLADLYRRYCNQNDVDCGDEERRFTVLTVMSFITAGGWGVVVLHAIVRACCIRRERRSSSYT